MTGWVKHTPFLALNGPRFLSVCCLTASPRISVEFFSPASCGWFWLTAYRILLGVELIILARVSCRTMITRWSAVDFQKFFIMDIQSRGNIWNLKYTQGSFVSGIPSTVFFVALRLSPRVHVYSMHAHTCKQHFSFYPTRTSQMSFYSPFSSFRSFFFLRLCVHAADSVAFLPSLCPTGGRLKDYANLLAF